MLIFKKLLSYIYPVTVSKIESAFTPDLEARLENGRLVLNAASANYSYGKLHGVMDEAISRVELNSIRNCLLLGMGAGSAITVLHKKNNHLPVDAVEIDHAVIETARDLFNVTQSRNVHIIHENAFEFIKRCPDNYDLVIIDLFIDDKVPEEVFSKIFLTNCRRVLSSHGTIILNAAIPHRSFSEKNESAVKSVFLRVSSGFIKGNLVYFMNR